MSKKHGIMDKWFQDYNIFRILNVDELPDDFLKHVDYMLHLPENLAKLRDQNTYIDTYIL